MNFLSYHIFAVKRKKFEWIEECAVNFEKLNHLLINALILKIIDPDKEFVVCIDACKSLCWSYDVGRTGSML